MKKPILAAAVLAASLSSQAFAQASNFQGLSLGLGLNVANTKTEVADATGTNSSTDTDTNAMLQLQYLWALGDSFVLGAGATANLGYLKAGTLGTNQLKEKDAYSLFVAPGYAFDSSTLGYVKLAYLNANVNGGNGTSVKFDDGYGFGLGLQSMLTRNWFGQAEYMYSKYTDRTPLPGTTVKLKSDAITLTVGYKF